MNLKYKANNQSIDQSLAYAARARGFEPRSKVLETSILPLNYARISKSKVKIQKSKGSYTCTFYSVLFSQTKKPKVDLLTSHKRGEIKEIYSDLE